MNISDRLVNFLEYKGISKNKFYINTGLSNGFLDKKPNIGADKIELILEKYPDINLYWLINGTGEMLRETRSLIPKPVQSNSITREELIMVENKSLNTEIEYLKRENALLKSIIEEKEATINMLKK